MTSYTIAGRMAWKEYRVLRVAWLFHLGLLLWCLWAMPYLYDDLGRILPSLVALPLQIVALYALGCGATMFALENEEETVDLLRRLPGSATSVLAGKLLFFVISAAALIACAIVLGAWFGGLGLMEVVASSRVREAGEAAYYADADVQRRLWSVAILEALAWSVFFSLLVRRPVVAAILGVIGGAIGASLAIAIDSGIVAMGWKSVPRTWATGHFFERWDAAWGARLVLLGCVMLADSWLARRWYRGRVRIGGSGERRSGADAGGSEIELGESAFRWPAGARLAWQQVRQLAWPWAGIALLMVTLCALGSDFQRSTFMLVAAAAVALVASSTFLVDQEGQRVRFLAQRGATSGSLWCSRQATSLAGSVAVVTGMWLLFWLVNRFSGGEVAIVGEVARTEITWQRAGEWSLGRNWNEWIRMVLNGLLPLSLAYACGQWCSLFIRASLLAAVVTLLLVAAACGWWLLMMSAGIPLLPSVAPISLLLLLSTRLRVKGWMLERTGWRGWWAGGWPVALLVTMPVGASIYRAVEIPVVEPGFDVAEFNRPLTPEELETAKLYQRAEAALAVDYRFPRTWNPASRAEESTGEPAIRVPHVPFGISHTERQHQWYESNAEALPLALLAARSGPARVEAGSLGRNFDHHETVALADLVRFEGERLQEEGQLDEAWRHYIDALRILGYARERSSFQVWTEAWSESDLYESMVAWCAAKGQTSERILEALDELKREEDQLPSERSFFQHHYVELMRVLEGDERGSVGKQSQLDDATRDREQRALWWLMRVLPGEYVRMRRLANYSTARMLHRLDELEAFWSGQRPYSENVADFISGENRMQGEFLWTVVSPWSSNWSWAADRVLFYAVRREGDRRAVRLRMALLAWAQDHGHLPESLDVLTPRYLEVIPTNPWAPGPIGYYPEGMKENLLDLGQRLIPAGTPLLWMSDLPHVVRSTDPREATKSVVYGIPKVDSED